MKSTPSKLSRLPKIGSATIQRLQQHGYFTPEDLQQVTIKQLTQISGFGKKRATQLLEAVANSLHTADSDKPIKKQHTEHTMQPPPPLPPTGIDLESHELYLNRELTWLNFNSRVLHEAADSRTPLLERLKFLSISDSNLDEFFMKRIGGLKQQEEAGVHQLTVDGRTPREQIDECHIQIREMAQEQLKTYFKLLKQLKQNNIYLSHYDDLNNKQRNILRQQFIDAIFPLLTPLAMDPGHPFPFISNLTLNLLVILRFPGELTSRMARIKLPVGKASVKRFYPVDDIDDPQREIFIPVEDIVSHNLDLLFPGMEILTCELFRVTRNANTEKDEEEADDLLAMIESELQDRHFSPIVRLQVQQEMVTEHRGMLAAELGLDEESDVFGCPSLMAIRDLFELAVLNHPELSDPSHSPLEHHQLAYDSRLIFHHLRNDGPILLQHPYESFSTTVEHFLEAASIDPKVLTIKMTLYRTSAESKIIESLVRAARNGKQVAVLVELKARFDEAANIRWARRLEQAGIHVTYGVVGLKTHSKVILVLRQDYNGLRHYAHIGTGNYHSGTARLYTDLGMLTNDRDIGKDLTELFNYLTGYSPPPTYRKILTAPSTLKSALLKRIEREISVSSEKKPGLIQFKANALEDVDITHALYKASQAGVKIDLIIRDTCRLRPGVPGVSDHIQVISIVGSFLEHARIFYFQNGGNEEYYIGSADLMKRNLEGRVEVVAPVEDLDLRQDLRMILNLQLDDQRSAWDMQADGSYLQRTPTDDTVINSQQTLLGFAHKRLKAAAKHQQKKIRKKLLNKTNQKSS
ncbi:MAG: polyphosphate kinase 1 [Gammaproteobacteria bacterium]|jgi:polyphosphate kinase|nr:polyphosphate kinase 1 [Gammaproteobacteria bacterium]MBT3489199.1 polyphosphate kinase 1 [Gammaproteobacteria bacterium]MBT3718088.1 polyphosphate kinase 1 [Gammaproteobacteria bacterium]MBT3893483.1 polyphosphate kinase 1 [Gammaproteobacteria bacterium]MBT4301209.1 polyphosphate kinase 1 [Gammaproteobacteria bacterium]